MPVKILRLQLVYADVGVPAKIGFTNSFFATANKLEIETTDINFKTADFNFTCMKRGFYCGIKVLCNPLNLIIPSSTKSQSVCIANFQKTNVTKNQHARSNLVVNPATYILALHLQIIEKYSQDSRYDRLLTQ